jgi:hypothetical protein
MVSKDPLTGATDHSLVDRVPGEFFEPGGRTPIDDSYLKLMASVFPDVESTAWKKHDKTEITLRACEALREAADLIIELETEAQALYFHTLISTESVTALQKIVPAYLSTLKEPIPQSLQETRHALYVKFSERGTALDEEAREIEEQELEPLIEEIKAATDFKGFQEESPEYETLLELSLKEDPRVVSIQKRLNQSEMEAKALHEISIQLKEMTQAAPVENAKDVQEVVVGSSPTISALRDKIIEGPFQHCITAMREGDLLATIRFIELATSVYTEKFGSPIESADALMPILEYCFSLTDCTEEDLNTISMMSYLHSTDDKKETGQVEYKLNALSSALHYHLNGNKPNKEIGRHKVQATFAPMESSEKMRWHDFEIRARLLARAPDAPEQDRDEGTESEETPPPTEEELIAQYHKQQIESKREELAVMQRDIKAQELERSTTQGDFQAQEEDELLFLEDSILSQYQTLDRVEQGLIQRKFQLHREEYQLRKANILTEIETLSLSAESLDSLIQASGFDDPPNFIGSLTHPEDLFNLFFHDEDPNLAMQGSLLDDIEKQLENLSRRMTLFNMLITLKQYHPERPPATNRTAKQTEDWEARRDFNDIIRLCSNSNSGDKEFIEAERKLKALQNRALAINEERQLEDGKLLEENAVISIKDAVDTYLEEMEEPPESMGDLHERYHQRRGALLNMSAQLCHATSLEQEASRPTISISINGHTYIEPRREEKKTVQKFLNEQIEVLDKHKPDKKKELGLLQRLKAIFTLKIGRLTRFFSKQKIKQGKLHQEIQKQTLATAPVIVKTMTLESEEKEHQRYMKEREAVRSLSGRERTRAFDEAEKKLIERERTPKGEFELTIEGDLRTKALIEKLDTVGAILVALGGEHADKWEHLIKIRETIDMASSHPNQDIEALLAPYEGMVRGAQDTINKACEASTETLKKVPSETLTLMKEHHSILVLKQSCAALIRPYEAAQTSSEGSISVDVTLASLRDISSCLDEAHDLNQYVVLRLKDNIDRIRRSGTQQVGFDKFVEKYRQANQATDRFKQDNLRDSAKEVWNALNNQFVKIIFESSTPEIFEKDKALIEQELARCETEHSFEALDEIVEVLEEHHARLKGIISSKLPSADLSYFTKYEEGFQKAKEQYEEVFQDKPRKKEKHPSTIQKKAPPRPAPSADELAREALLAHREKKEAVIHVACDILERKMDEVKEVNTTLKMALSINALKCVLLDYQNFLLHETDERSTLYNRFTPVNTRRQSIEGLLTALDDGETSMEARYQNAIRVISEMEQPLITPSRSHGDHSRPGEKWAASMEKELALYDELQAGLKAADTYVKAVPIVEADCQVHVVKIIQKERQDRAPPPAPSESTSLTTAMRAMSSTLRTQKGELARAAQVTALINLERNIARYLTFMQDKAYSLNITPRIEALQALQHALSSGNQEEAKACFESFSFTLAEPPPDKDDMAHIQRLVRQEAQDAMNGTDKEVGAFLKRRANVLPFIDKCESLLHDLKMTLDRHPINQAETIRACKALSTHLNKVTKTPNSTFDTLKSEMAVFLDALEKPLTASAYDEALVCIRKESSDYQLKVFEGSKPLDAIQAQIVRIQEAKDDATLREEISDIEDTEYFSFDEDESESLDAANSQFEASLTSIEQHELKDEYAQLRASRSHRETPQERLKAEYRALRDDSDEAHLHLSKEDLEKLKQTFSDPEEGSDEFDSGTTL